MKLVVYNIHHLLIRLFAPSYRFKDKLSEVDIIAFDGILKANVESLVRMLAPVWNLKGQVELLRTQDEQIIAKQLLQFQPVVNRYAQICGTTTHLTWKELKVSMEQQLERAGRPIFNSIELHQTDPTVLYIPQNISSRGRFRLVSNQVKSNHFI